MESYSNFGATYIPLDGAYQPIEDKSHLNGDDNVTVKEM